MQNPTQEQIKERCLEIQRSWTPQERRSRRVASGRRPSPGIRVVRSPDNVSEEVRRECYSWQFLHDDEVVRAKRAEKREEERKAAIEETILSEALEDQEFEPVPVKFGVSHA